MPALLGYWRLRGLGQTIRLMLGYTETEFTEKLYEFGPAPEFDASEWTNEKFSLGMDLPNLPYYIDGSHKITQSNAILRYIARKHDLCGKSEDEVIKVDMLENQAMDMRMAWIRLVYDHDKKFESNKVTYTNETLPGYLKLLNDFIGPSKWFAGNNLTLADFLLYELLDINRIFIPGCLKNFENLEKFMVRFESLETIKKYMSCSKFMKTPLNGPMAVFVGE